ARRALPLQPVAALCRRGAALRASHRARADGVPRILRALTHELGQPEGEVERLPRVEARVEQRLVARREVLLEQVAAATETLGHVFARELEVHAAGPGAGLPAGGEEAFDLRHDRVEAARL